MFFPKNQNEMEQPKGGSIESLFSDHAEAPLAHRDVYPKQQLPTPTTKKGVNNTLSSSDQVQTIFHLKIKLNHSPLNL
jgi:hypothetical protein